MTLTFQDGTVDAFRVHQKHAVKCCIGFSHFTKCHDISVTKEGNLLTVTIKNTKEQLNNEKAERLKKEGEAAMKQKQFEAAIKKYDEALSLANKSQTIDAIKSDKAAARNEQGRSSLQKGWDLENVTTEDKSQEAKNQFNKAQSMFEQAESLKHTSEQENNLKITKIKIEGNRLFNEANQLEMEAFKLFQEAKESKFLDGYATSQNKYKEVLDKYKAAKEKFDEGLKMKETKFDVCSQIASEHIKEILKVINDINKVELKHNFNQVNVEVEEEENKDDLDDVTINSNVHEQRDVINA
ncbi:TPR 11 domain containing protein [Asbolus verrucosus]|uniref:TPR 11 domain containing protein n=1 Tax=Asbolus verrucosus TaxID=1661398 RepID=A0A482VJ68_ASBVE|nr:TPR 11 domain containing protein [Asbolus verrucosus]